MLIFQSFGAPELLIILAIVVVLFGASRMATLAKVLAVASASFVARSRMARPKTPTTKTLESP